MANPLDQYEKKFITLMKSEQQSNEALLDLFHQIRSDIKKLEPSTNIEAIERLEKKFTVLEQKVTSNQKILEAILNVCRK